MLLYSGCIIIIRCIVLLHRLTMISPSLITTINRLTRILGFDMSNLKYKRDLYASQFHSKGHRHFQRSRELSRESSTTLKDIENYTLNMQKIWLTSRNNSTGQSNTQSLQIEAEQLNSYLQSYIKLVEAINESRFNEEWYYLIAGWYNIQTLLPHLIQKLIIETNKNRHFSLVEAISWMQPHSYTLPSELQFYQMQRENKNIDFYYKHLNNSLSLASVKHIESIFHSMETPNKARFYERYVHSNLSALLKYQEKGNREQIDGIFWLYKMYVETYNDREDIISKFDQFCDKLQPGEISQQNSLTLMEIYSAKGKIDPRVYQKHLKQFIKPTKDTPVKFAIKSLSFLLHSEAEDSQMIGLLLKHIDKAMLTYKIDEQTQLELHHLCHYMSVKGVRFELQRSTMREMHECCRQHEGNGTLARTIAINLDEKGRQEGVKYYESDCLRKDRQPSAIKQDIGAEIKQVPNFKRYTKVRICTMDISNCVMNDESKQLVVLENVYHRFEHSKRMSRYFELREAILGHYGVKVNYLERKDTFKKMPSEQSLDSLV